MAKLEEAMRANPANVRFNDLKKVCEHYFGRARQEASSHAVFRMPWPGDPRINIQDHKGKAKPYQVRQALDAIDRFKREREEECQT